MIKPIAAFALTGILVLSACEPANKRVRYDGEVFRTKAKALDKDRDTFVLTVRDPGKSIAGARQAAHHKGTEYCIRAFGTSDIIWDIDPLDEEAQPRIVDGVMTFQGRCPQAQRI